MSGWLTKAAGALRGERPEQPEPFETVCECGVRHTGLRRRKPQRIICRSCGVALFVLPRDVYPVPSAPPPRPRKRRKRTRRAAVPPTAPPRFQQVATNVFRASEQVGRSAASAGRGLGARVRDFVLAFAALWTPLRLIVLGMVFVCAATLAYSLLSNRSEQAVMDLKVADEAARKAMAEGDVAGAQQQFSAAVAALDQLHRHDDPLSREIRQLHRETTALRNLLAVSPLQVAAAADAALQSGAAESWTSEFRTQYRNRWLIVHGPLQRVLAGPEQGLYALTLPVRLGPERRQVELHLPLPQIDDLIKAGKARTVVFAAQLVACDLSADRTTWKLRVAADSAFVWGTMEGYRLAGFTFESPAEEQQVGELLAGQARLIGLPTAGTSADPPGARDQQ